jgi:hypothetical protein
LLKLKLAMVLRGQVAGMIVTVTNGALTIGTAIAITSSDGPSIEVLRGMKR